MSRSFVMVAGICAFATTAAADPSSPLVNPSFERGLEGWTKTGTAFDTQPTFGDNVRAARVNPVSLGGTYWVDLPYPIGIRGTSWIGTFENRPTPRARAGTTQGDGPTGTLTSAKFKIPADVRFISFLIGGGDDVARLKIELLDASGATAVPAPGIPPKTGHGSEILRRDWWRVDALDKRKDHVIRITDAATGAWGHINPGGHQNARDLTPLGEVAINEMMKLGMIIDIDHMSDLAANETLALALARNYPLNSGHTGFRDLPGLRPEEINENMRSSAQLTTLGELGGMMGVGWANGHAGKFLEAYEWGIDHKRRTRNGPSPAFTLGSDINGFEGTPWPRHSPHPKAQAHIRKLGRGRISAASWNTRVQYSGPGALRQYTFAERTWDYNVDGVAHIGLYPDFFQDLKNLGMRDEALDHFFRAADAFAQMWDKIEIAKTSVR